MTTKTLLDHHLKMLAEDSAINPDVIEKRGYYSVTDPGQLTPLGFSDRQASVISEKYPGLVIPYYKPDGENGFFCLRPDNPRSIDDKKKRKLEDGTYPQKVFKYELPRGAGNILDCHPLITSELGNPDKPIVFTEGAKKTDSLISKGFVAINLNGVYGWRGTNKQQGKTTLGDFESIALNGRRIVILFDSDFKDNPNIQSALRRFKYFLEGKGGIVTPVLLPQPEDEKIGVDDWFASGQTAKDLKNLVDYFGIFALDLGSGRKRWNTERFIDLFREWNYTLRINDMNESKEINGELLDDTKLDIIRCRLKDEKIPVTHAEYAITLVANANRYHPIKDYLNGLAWDGKDHIEKLSMYFIDEGGVFGQWLKRWLVGSVAKVFGDGNNENFMLTLGGPQYQGKSHFARWLCPLEDYFLESPLYPDDKDSLVRLMSSWIWEVGELGAVTRRADREALKRIITMRTVAVRKSYGRVDTVKPAIASFIGTVNPEGDGFLNDPTGNRRYAVAILTSIDWDYANEVDINQLWAHAKHIYDNRGDTKPWVMEPCEQQKRDEINLQHTTQDPLEDDFFTQFELDLSPNGKMAYKMSTPKILGSLGHSRVDKNLARRLAVILKLHGVEKTNNVVRAEGERVRLWQGVKTLDYDNVT